MNHSHFFNETGKYTAKRMPAPKGTSVKFKDVSDLFELRADLQDYKPSTVEQFITIYKRCFDSACAYEVEVEPFDAVIESNRNNFLGTNSWLKKYWSDFIDIYDPDVLEDEYEWFVINDNVAKAFIKAGIAKKKELVDDEDWSNFFSNYKLSELKTIVKPLGIKVSQSKPSLIKELINYQENNTPLFPLPIVIKFLPTLNTLLKSLQQQYIADLSLSFENFDYPREFKAAVWLDVIDCNFNNYIVTELAKDILLSFSDIDGVIDKPSTVAPNTSSYSTQESTDSLIDIATTLEQSIVIVFDYVDFKNEPSSREFRLDKLVQNEYTYLHGFCFYKNAARQFRIDRIQGDIIIKDTGEAIPKEDIVSYLGINHPNPIIKPKTTNSIKSINTRDNYDNSTLNVDSLDRKVSLLLGIGVFIMPIIFSWFTLRKGHSIRSKIVSFSWLALILLVNYPDNPSS